MSNESYRPHFFPSPSQLKQARAWFLRFLPKKGRVLDLGCGRGEVLELLAGQGFQSQGVESDPELVTVCRGKGLEVEAGDVIEYLGRQHEAWDGVFIGHLIEHMPSDVAHQMLAHARQALRSGGRVVVLTPNPNWLPGVGAFWADPTHVRPYPIAAMRDMLESLGFRIVDAGIDPASKLRPDWGRPLHALVDLCRLLLLRLIVLEHYDGGEIYVVAEKP